MAKVFPANLPPDAFPRVRGVFLVQPGIAGPQAQKWPRKRGKPTHPAVIFTSTQFGIAGKMAANSEPMQYETARFLSEHSDWLPRDILTLAAYGKLYEVYLPDGTKCDVTDHGYAAASAGPPQPSPASTRYFRVWVPTGYHRNLRCAELKLYTTATSTTPIPIATITASSAGSATPASNAIDGNPSTYWESIAFTFPNWLLVDFGVDQNFPVAKVEWTTSVGQYTRAPSEIEFQTATQADPGTFNPSFGPFPVDPWTSGETETWLWTEP